jgi:hypothetical protein
MPASTFMASAGRTTPIYRLQTRMPSCMRRRAGARRASATWAMS